MVKTGQYIVGSVMPTMGRVGQVSKSLTLPTTTLGAGDSTYVQTDVDVGSGQLTNVAMEVMGTTYVLNVLLIEDEDWRIEVWFERTSATRARLTIWLGNNGYDTKTHDAITVKVYTNAFDCP